MKRISPLSDEINISSESLGTTPFFKLGEAKEDFKGARSATIEAPSGDHAGSSHKAGFFDNFIGFPLPSDRAFQRWPPDSSQVIKLIQFPSVDQAGINSLGRSTAVKRLLFLPFTSFIQIRPKEENAILPSFEIANCCTCRDSIAP